MCAPDSTDRPIASASSCNATATICSGVWCSPVKMTSAPALRRAHATTFAPPVVAVEARFGDHHPDTAH